MAPGDQAESLGPVYPVTVAPVTVNLTCTASAPEGGEATIFIVWVVFAARVPPEGETLTAEAGAIALKAIANIVTNEKIGSLDFTI
ncbi:hypothetical protein GF389_05320 [Candidatus Dojkabacteria bacterium]|nr:hypothetical protein [Candidatus Dojkabacteria bacterium]